MKTIKDLCESIGNLFIENTVENTNLSGKVTSLMILNYFIERYVFKELLLLFNAIGLPLRRPNEWNKFSLCETGTSDFKING